MVWEECVGVVVRKGVVSIGDVWFVEECECVGPITRRNFATDARVRKVQKTKNASL